MTDLLPKKQKFALRQQSHHLKPIIHIGQKGLTDAVFIEIERALFDHELIKIKIDSADKAERQAIIESISASRDAAVIHHVGHTATFYRKRPPEKS